jgi:hypothetical protein
VIPVALSHSYSDDFLGYRNRSINDRRSIEDVAECQALSKRRGVADQKKGEE